MSKKPTLDELVNEFFMLSSMAGHALRAQEGENAVAAIAIITCPTIGF